MKLSSEIEIEVLDVERAMVLDSDRDGLSVLEMFSDLEIEIA